MWRACSPRLATSWRSKASRPNRYNAYRGAARSVANATERLDVLFEQGRLRELNGVGNALEAKIIEYLATGRMEVS